MNLSQITAFSPLIKMAILLQKGQIQFISVQSLSHIWLFANPWTAACQASLSITNFWSLLKLMSIQSAPSVQFSSVAQSCPTLCKPMDCSMPGLPVHHQLPDLTQTHVCWVGNAIQPSHPLPPPSPRYTLLLHSPAKTGSFY